MLWSTHFKCGCNFYPLLVSYIILLIHTIAVIKSIPQSKFPSFIIIIISLMKNKVSTKGWPIGVYYKYRGCNKVFIM